VTRYDKVVFEERPVAGAGVRLRLDDDGAIATAAVVAGALTPAPVRAVATAALLGCRPADISPSQRHDVANACAAEVIASALVGNRTAFMASVTGDLIERVLASALQEYEGAGS
jgi:CO/xanthine dehydrogenase FAD-binding subunit